MTPKWMPWVALAVWSCRIPAWDVRGETPQDPVAAAEEPAGVPPSASIAGGGDESPNLGVQATETKPAAWSRLFNGKSIDGWKITNFGGEGKVTVHEGVLRLETGSPLSGISWSGKPPMPPWGYEIRVACRRVAGSDFFCGLTFPYGDSHCTLVLGGWGGGLCGLSSLNGRDASENETMRILSFETGRWYDVRLEVLEGRIRAWLDDRKIVDCVIEGRKVGTRIEVELSKPLGFAAYDTVAELSRLDWRQLAAGAIPTGPRESR